MEKDPNLMGNPALETAIEKLQKAPTQENLVRALSVLRRRMQEKGHLITAVEQSETEGLQLKTIQTADGKNWFAAYTGFEEQTCGGDPIMSGFTAEIAQLFKMAMETKTVEGLIINPWRRTLMLDKTLIQIVIGAQQ